MRGRETLAVHTKLESEVLRLQITPILPTRTCQARKSDREGDAQNAVDIMEKGFGARYTQEQHAALDLEDFAVGFSFQMEMSPQSQAVPAKKLYPILPTTVWPQDKKDREDRWRLFVKNGNFVKQVTYAKYKTFVIFNVYLHVYLRFMLFT